MKKDYKAIEERIEEINLELIELAEEKIELEEELER